MAGLLRAQGHQVYTPTLTGLGERAHLLGPKVDLECHIRDVVGVLRFEDLREAILVGHGYGGMVITGAADRAHRHVGHLVYLDAPVPTDGESLADIAPGPIAALRNYVLTLNGIELCHPPTAELSLLCGVTDRAMREWMLPRLTPQPWRCFEQPLKLNDEVALRTIPQSHIVSALGSSHRDASELRKRSDGRFWELRTGHDLMLTEPEWTAEKLAATAEWLPRSYAPSG
ncbi:pimeloyl-ACP methyl ester carboxylesterase [Mycolicibacterium sp. BK556]|nr:pimeloyl-ACP methyl ester carboxylesterase [Mycolicibacterium sp. BK556]MBB3636262.1 pimeloyl-ACP methyl ester carboxylesterase [Mycolicibacterium sp. BK607]MBB3753554.1 pimeloyl-ACP methyl ester carboxylesterase [Mycolicibacterium sp. BK634]